MQDYRKLEVATRSRAHAVAIRECSQRFPRSGYSELKSQMTTAAESFELEGQLELSTDYGIIPLAESSDLTKETIEIRKMLCTLRRRVIESDDY